MYFYEFLLLFDHFLLLFCYFFITFYHFFANYARAYRPAIGPWGAVAPLINYFICFVFTFLNFISLFAFSFLFLFYFFLQSFWTKLLSEAGESIPPLLTRIYI